MARIYFMMLGYAFAVIVLFNSEVAGTAFKFLGCYPDSPTSRDLGGTSTSLPTPVTVLSCADKCSPDGYAYAGLQAGTQCYCGDSYGLTVTSSVNVECNFTCGTGQDPCGGIGFNSDYYALDSSVEGERVLQVYSSSKSFKDARATCVKANGDLLSLKTAAVDGIVSAVNALNISSITSVWIGLRKRKLTSTGVYEWTNENYPEYFSHMADFSNLWALGDLGKDCVSVDISQKRLKSVDCTTSLPFVCNQLPDPSGSDGSTTTPSSPSTTDVGADSKRLALFIVLPIFLFCYGGACILYCIHKIIKHCVRRKPGKMMLPSDDVKTAPLATPIPAPPMQAKIPARPPSSRPLSGKKAAVYPAPPPMEMAGPLQPKVPPSFVYQHGSAQPIKKDPMKFFEDEPVTARNVQVVEDPPPMYTDKREEKRAKLLENAAKESRERQQKAAEEGRPASRPFTAPKRQAPETPPKADEAPAPENQGSTTNLISQAESPRDAATPPQNMAGMSISDILRMKMAQQAKQKRPRKILAA